MASSLSHASRFAYRLLNSSLLIFYSSPLPIFCSSPLVLLTLVEFVFPSESIAGWTTESPPFKFSFYRCFFSSSDRFDFDFALLLSDLAAYLAISSAMAGLYV